MLKVKNWNKIMFSKKSFFLLKKKKVSYFPESIKVNAFYPRRQSVLLENIGRFRRKSGLSWDIKGTYEIIKRNSNKREREKVKSRYFLIYFWNTQTALKKKSDCYFCFSRNHFRNTRNGNVQPWKNKVTNSLLTNSAANNRMKMWFL